MATWEDTKSLKQRFPFSPAWGQVVLQEEGNVGTSTSGPSTRMTRPSIRVHGPEWE
jgi:hypothetical protein